MESNVGLRRRRMAERRRRELENYRSSRLSRDARHFTNLYIDTTTVKNVAGTNCTGRNPCDRGRLGTKISIIIDNEKIPVSEPLFFGANISDIKTIEDSVKSIPFALRKDNRVTLKLAGDKAYRSDAISRRLFQKKKIRIVAALAACT